MPAGFAENESSCQLRTWQTFARAETPVFEVMQSLAEREGFEPSLEHMPY